MTSFTESALVKKLIELNASQQSIQTLSFWLIHHRKHHAIIVKTWYKELQKANEQKKLTFMYLANDVIQNSKKKGPEYGKEFGSVLAGAFEHISASDDDKIKSSIGRLLNIWEERGVYDATQIREFRDALDGKITQKKPKKRKIDSPDPKQSKNERRSKSPGIKSETTIEVDGLKETHLTLSPRTPAGDPPEPEELIKAIQDLENSASGDAAVRQRIANLPPEVSDISLLSKLEDKEQAQKLSLQVNEAVTILADYNKRLADEMEDRKKLANMLRDFMQAQRELMTQAEQRLEEYNNKLQKIYEVRQEVKSHVRNLPDLSRLPDVTGGLAPLPSAGDLFNR
ncbi:regulation of nuclear pre-mRNA domain-containing protein 1B [Ctenocephalides felis]|uniref:regulation of nuclear pre-mRNA domain-containing protein 1B n=1 Tax=Ctenocephalides felis TaxID=7515 RepID=UPI000E6E153A|nr:regulation of nuclear pre-mRNA domain-containing protein 1B [Ctenocephalides felis]